MNAKKQSARGRPKRRVRTRHVVTLNEMASMIGLSRSRFYQLVKEGVFPRPVFEMFGRKAVYIRPQQVTCLAVWRFNCGMNGRSVRFRNIAEIGKPRRGERAL